MNAECSSEDGPKEYTLHTYTQLTAQRTNERRKERKRDGNRETGEKGTAAATTAAVCCIYETRII